MNESGSLVLLMFIFCGSAGGSREVGEGKGIIFQTLQTSNDKTLSKSGITGNLCCANIAKVINMYGGLSIWKALVISRIRYI